MSKPQTIKDVIAEAILDGQNQIHDLRDKKATPRKVEKRMRQSVDFHYNKIREIVHSMGEMDLFTSFNIHSGNMNKSNKKLFKEALKPVFKELNKFENIKAREACSKGTGEIRFGKT